MSSPHLSSGGESDTLLSEFRRELDAFYVSAESMVITQCHQPAQGNYIEAQAWCVSVNQGFTSRTPITLRLTAVPRDGEPDPKSGVSVRYRVVVDRTRCGGDFRLSRQASYMDPISGSVMPTAFDNVIFPTLRSFIDDGIRRLFEQKPPLMDYGSVANNAAATTLTTFPPTVELNNVAAFQHIFQDASKTEASARDVNREYELRTFAVLRDLSKFGDGLSRYDPSLGIIRVHIPIFNTKQATTRSGQPMSTEGSPLGVNSTSSTSVTDVEVLTTLRVCIRLQINADAVPPPTVYLVDAAGGSLHRDWSLGFGPSTPPTAEECQYMEHLFVPLLELESDARTLRVRPSLVAQWWQPEASVYQLLQQLQAEITSLLRKASTQSNDMDDWFATFNSPVTAAPKPFVRIGTMDKCLLCGSQPKSVAFVPCGHIAMCRSCARRMMVEKNQSAPFRSREPTGANMFPCVVCKTMVQECRLLL